MKLRSIHDPKTNQTKRERQRPLSTRRLAWFFGIRKKMRQERVDETPPEKIRRMKLGFSFINI